MLIAPKNTYLICIENNAMHVTVGLWTQASMPAWGLNFSIWPVSKIGQ